MNKDDIKLLESFRDKIDRYMFLGHIPPEPTPFGSNEDHKRMRNALKKPQFQKLRREINELIPQVEQILSKLDVAYLVTYYPAPVSGRPPMNLNIFSLMLDNKMDEALEKESLMDRIDQAIGKLKSGDYSINESSQKPIMKDQVDKGFVFIAMPMDKNIPELEDVHKTIKRTAREIGLTAERVDDPESNERITDRIIESIERAEFMVVDLTHSKPNVFFEAGYAHGIGKTPIYIAKKGTELEFDLKDYPVIFFRNISNLEELLSKRLKALSTSKNAG